MFNGIIKNTGIINKVYRKNNNTTVEILSNIKFSKKEIGSSISCSGACLSLENFRGKLSKASISKSGIWLRQGSENNKIVIRAENFLPEENLFKNATFYMN